MHCRIDLSAGTLYLQRSVCPTSQCRLNITPRTWPQAHHGGLDVLLHVPWTLWYAPPKSGYTVLAAWHMLNLATQAISRCRLNHRLAMGLDVASLPVHIPSTCPRQPRGFKQHTPTHPWLTTCYMLPHNHPAHPAPLHYPALTMTKPATPTAC